MAPSTYLWNHEEKKERCRLGALSVRVNLVGNYNNNNNNVLWSKFCSFPSDSC